MGKSMPDLPDQTVTTDTTKLELRAAKLQQQSDAAASKIGRTMDILRYYNWLQIARRATNLVKKRLAPSKKIQPLAVTAASLRADKNVAKLAHLIIEQSAEHPSHVQVDLDQGRFVLLNHTVDLYDQGVLQNQTLNQQTHLWRFQFHYHEFLFSQVAAGRWKRVETFLNQWLDDFAPQKVLAKDDAWHPYCISRRVIAWVWLLVNAGGKESTLSTALSKRLVKSLLHQTQYLSKNLEWDLGGNHLIENVTALAVVGGMFDSTFAKGWQKTASDVLAKELPNQILVSGEHFERSPMYHCQILSNLLRIEICCEKHSDLAAVVEPVIDPMLNFLSNILHPDGEIPLFADSVFHEAPSVEQIIDVAKISGRNFGESNNTMDPSGNEDYFAVKTDRTFAICDFGPIAATYLPAHGHCDALNLEVSIDNQRWIVDSGNFNYADDSMRHYCRSSIAHNVVTVADQNQAKIWSMFRMGRRPKVCDHQHGLEDGWDWASASHNGYENWGVLKLKRLIAVQLETLMCFDVPVLGSKLGADKLIGYVHLHPDLSVGEIEPAGDSCFRIGVHSEGVRRWLIFHSDSVTLEKGWYCETFGQRKEGIVVRYVTNLPCKITGFILQKGPDNFEAKLHDGVFKIKMSNLMEFRFPPF